MKIAVCAPVDLHELAQFCGQDRTGIAPGLGGTATTPLISEFLRRGHDITLYTLSKESPGEQTYRWANLRIRVGRFRERHLAATYYWPEIAFLNHAIREDAPDFVHAHWTYEFALGALRSGVPTLTTIHDLPWNVLRYYRDPHRAVRLLMAYEAALRGRHFAAVSEAAARHFSRLIRPGTRISVIPNGLPDEVFALARHSESRPRHTITFATILQGWSRRKNPQEALRAFRIARQQLPNASLLMFGCGYELNGSAHLWAKKHALDRDVEFVGPLPHRELLRRISNEVDIVVHPSRDEAFSMAALEALALRKALIAGETTPGMREMLGPGGGILIDVRNPAAIAQAMFQLAVNADYRRHLANRCSERAFRLFRMSTIAGHYEALYREMLQTQTTIAGALKPQSGPIAPL